MFHEIALALIGLLLVVLGALKVMFGGIDGVMISGIGALLIIGGASGARVREAPR